MEIKKYNINKNEYTFVCEVWSNYRSWGHRVNLLRNNYEIAEARIRYYNRTWENYEFQTCMLKAIRIIEEHKQTSELEYYKEKTERKRLREAEKQEIYSNCEELKELKELEKRVRGRIW